MHTGKSDQNPVWSGFLFYKNNAAAQYTSKRAIMRLTAFVCLAKNLQKTEPNSAHTKDPDAPITVSISVNPISETVE